MKIVKQLLATMALLGTAVVANATPTTWVDTIDWNPDRYVGQWTSVQYQHDITDDGFVAGTDTVSSYSLAVNLFDDSKNDPLEVALITLPYLSGARAYVDLSGTEFGGWSLQGWTELNETGKLDVTITSLLGDFYLGSSTLTVTGDHVGVPEPSTLALMGLGLIGVAGFSRRKKI